MSGQSSVHPEGASPNSADRTFTDQFLDCLPKDAPIEDRAALEEFLAKILKEARSEWPDIELETTSFMPYLARFASQDDDLLDALRKLRSADLYLTCACLDGDPTALKCFESLCTPVVVANLRRMNLGDSEIDELLQRLRDKMFVGSEGKERKLSLYRGRCTLRSWVRVTAVRMAVDDFRSARRRERPLDDEVLFDLASPGDQELAFLKRHYRQEFKVVFQDALAMLSSRERNILRRHLFDGLSIDELGVLYHVHRSTAARWLERIRSALLATTQRTLKERLQISSTEFESLVKLIISRFDPSLRRILAEEETAVE